MPFAKEVKPGTKVELSKVNPDEDAGLEKEDGLLKLTELSQEVGELQELMFAARQHSLLCVFQGRDTAGKDGAINRVISYVNVQSCRVSSFKVPTEEELAHDFLWRVHRETPGKGGITLFNRSHYEDVLVVRVHNLAPESIWKGRYDQINSFEQLLTSSGTIMLKFYLHIDAEEQEKRLLQREQEVEKSWKLSVGDWKEREFWSDYEEAYEDALSRCSTVDAPWLIVPANRKWYRDLCIAEAIRDALQPYREGWRSHLEEVGKRAKEELLTYRTTLKQA